MGTPTSIPRRVRALIGEIVTQGACLEHYITICLLKEMEVETFKGLSVLRQNNVNQKLQKLLFLVEARLDHEFAAKYEAISKDIDRFLECRNNMAHAYYTGTQYDKIREIDYMFTDTSDLVRFGDEFSTKTILYNIKNLRAHCHLATHIISEIRQLFGVQALHEVLPGTIYRSRPPTPREIRKNKRVKR